MNGQWSGSYSGTNSGLLVMDLDDMDTHYEGRVFAYDDTPALPGTFAFIKTPDKRSSFQLSVDFLPVDPRTGVRQQVRDLPDFATHRPDKDRGHTFDATNKLLANLEAHLSGRLARWTASSGYTAADVDVVAALKSYLILKNIF
jgi:hypothetical protein